MSAYKFRTTQAQQESQQIRRSGLLVVFRSGLIKNPNNCAFWISKDRSGLWLCALVDSENRYSTDLQRPPKGCGELAIPLAQEQWKLAKKLARRVDSTWRP